VFYIDIVVQDFFGSMWSDVVGSYEAYYGNTTEVYTDHLYLPVTVSSIFSSPSGKFSNSISTAIIMEYETFLPYAIQYLSPFMPQVKKDALAQADLLEYSQKLLLNLPPPRIDAYLSRYAVCYGHG
jgi:hypothetical protein